MKNIIKVLTLTLISMNIYSQKINNLDSLIILTKLKLLNEKGLIEKNKIYYNNDNLISENIFEYNNLTTKDLIKIIKNWGGEHFVSFKTVLVNETDNQLVIRYSDGSPIYPSYTKIIIDVKDSKIRIKIFDEDYKNLSIFFNTAYTSDINFCCSNGSGEIKNKHLNYINTTIINYIILTNNSQSINDYILKNQKIKKDDIW